MFKQKVQSLCSLLMPTKKTATPSSTPSGTSTRTDGPPDKKSNQLLYHRDIKIDRNNPEHDGRQSFDWKTN
jgi:hypothetical protein